jgi:hypothetical protein
MHRQSIRLSISDYLQYLYLLALVLIVLLPITPTNMPVASRDSGVFLYSGWRVMNGDIPYLDFWDHKPPLIFFVNALGLLISGSNRWGIWVIELISLSFATILGFKLLKNAFDTLTALYISFLWLFTLTFMLEGGNYTTEYTLPIQFGCMGLFWYSENKKSYRWRGLVIGVLAGMAFFLKQSTIGILIAILLYIFISRLSLHQWREMLKSFLLIIGGFLFVWACMLGLFVTYGSLQEFWSSAFLFNFVYTAGPTILERVTAIYRGWLLISKLNLAWFGVIGWFIALFTLLFNKASIKPNLLPLIALGLIDLPLEIVLVGLGGRLINHHFMTLLPVFTVLSGFSMYLFFQGISNSFGKIPHARKIWILILVLAVSTPFLYVKQFNDYIDTARAYRSDPDGNIPVIAYILENTSPDDTVLVMEAESFINFSTGRASPSKFVYQYPLNTAGYTTEVMVEEFLNAVISGQPALIIDKSGRWIQPDNFTVSSERIIEQCQIIQSDYALVDRIGIWNIYRFVGQ